MSEVETQDHYDWIIIGSGFGGSVSALRLAERGYRVLVLEKGRRYAKSDFPKNNWDLKRWMWRPKVGLTGFFQMSFLRHITVLHGVGVGGGSLVYANTLPTPGDAFFTAASWGHLADWKEELAPHYRTALQMLGAADNPRTTRSDEVLSEIAQEIGRAEHFHPTRVGVFFGEPGIEVADPFFKGQGPRRTGCTHCGACMTGCRVGAKNTLDRNYLYLAEQLGVSVNAETEVTNVRPSEGGGYEITTRDGLFRNAESRSFTADRVVFAGGVMGTVPLLLKLKEDTDSLPGLSPRLGEFVRTNNEALIGVIAPDEPRDLTEGVAITSILETDEHSHIEPVRYGPGSGFFRTMVLPMATGGNAFSRLVGAAWQFVRHPVRWMRALTVRDFSRHSQVLLYMRTLESTLKLDLGREARTGFQRGMVSKIEPGMTPPTAFIPEAHDLARRFADKVGGVVMTLLTETILGVPSTAHILGGCVMGRDSSEGVIDEQHRVFGYDGLYVIDGSAISANPGVNPSLTITALAERAMSQIPSRE